MFVIALCCALGIRVIEESTVGSNPTHSVRQKSCPKDIEISYIIQFAPVGISMFDFSVRSLHCAIACSRAHCSAAAQNHNIGGGM